MSDMAPSVPARQRPFNGRRNQTADALIGRLFCSGAINSERLRRVAEMCSQLRLGASSAAMVESAITGEPIPEIELPSDWDDLERCEIAHAIAPRWLAEAMAPTLIRFRAAVTAQADLRRHHPRADQFVSPRLPVSQ